MGLPKFIGITGKAQHGKDTTGLVLEEFGYKRFAFADGLREMALKLDPYVRGRTRLSYLVERVGWEGAKRNLEVRRILQVLGTECIRDMVGQDTWIQILSDRTREYAHSLPKGQARVVITDVRFPNEARAIQNVGGEVWRVDRQLRAARPVDPDRLDLEWTFEFDNGVDPTHPSEASVDLIAPDVQLLNGGTLEGYKDDVREYVKRRLADSAPTPGGPNRAV